MIKTRSAFHLSASIHEEAIIRSLYIAIFCNAYAWKHQSNCKIDNKKISDSFCVGPKVCHSSAFDFEIDDDHKKDDKIWYYFNLI